MVKVREDLKISHCVDVHGLEASWFELMSGLRNRTRLWPVLHEEGPATSLLVFRTKQTRKKRKVCAVRCHDGNLCTQKQPEAKQRKVLSHSAAVHTAVKQKMLPAVIFFAMCNGYRQVLASFIRPKNG